MNCMHCGNGTSVVDSRTVKGRIRRRRKCRVCQALFTTIETLTDEKLSVDGELLAQIKALNLRFVQLKTQFDVVMEKARRHESV